MPVGLFTQGLRVFHADALSLTTLRGTRLGYWLCPELVGSVALIGLVLFTFLDLNDFDFDFDLSMIPFLHLPFLGPC